MKLFKKCLAMYFVSLFIWSNLVSAGNESRGGNDIALDFISKTDLALDEIKRDYSKYPEVDLATLQRTLKSLKVFTTKLPLYVDTPRGKQESTAVNTKSTFSVVVNEFRWLAILDVRVKKALALHELLSLADLEDTGVYPISSRYLRELGVLCSEGLCDTPPRPTKKILSFQEAGRAYTLASKIKVSDMVGEWQTIGSVRAPEVPDSLLSPEAYDYYNNKPATNSGVYINILGYESAFGEKLYGIQIYWKEFVAESVYISKSYESSYANEIKELSQDVCFSSRVFMAPQSKIFHNYSCRELPNHNLICAISINGEIDNQTNEWTDFLHRNVLFFIFRKIK